MRKLFLIFSLILFLIPQKAFALDKNLVSLSPAFLEVNIKDPNEAQEILLTLTNSTDKDLSFELFPIDFKQQDENGNISFLQGNNASSYSLASFLSFEQREVLLDAGQKKVIKVLVQNKQSLSPGGHYAAIVARIKGGSNRSVEETVITPSVSSFILLRKEGGEQFNLSLTSVTPDQTLKFNNPNSYSLLLQNEGNIHLIPYGRVEVRDLFGRLLYDGMVNPSSSVILPESRRHIEAILTKISSSLPISINTITIKGNDSLKKTQYFYQDLYLYINPLAIYLVLAVSIFYIYRRRRDKKSKNE